MAPKRKGSGAKETPGHKTQQTLVLRGNALEVQEKNTASRAWNCLQLHAPAGGLGVHPPRIGRFLHSVLQNSTPQPSTSLSCLSQPPYCSAQNSRHSTPLVIKYSTFPPLLHIDFLLATLNSPVRIPLDVNRQGQRHPTVPT